MASARVAACFYIIVHVHLPLEQVGRELMPGRDEAASNFRLSALSPKSLLPIPQRV